MCFVAGLEFECVSVNDGCLMEDCDRKVGNGPPAVKWTNSRW